MSGALGSELEVSTGGTVAHARTPGTLSACARLVFTGFTLQRLEAIHVRIKSTIFGFRYFQIRLFIVVYDWSHFWFASFTLLVSCLLVWDCLPLRRVWGHNRVGHGRVGVEVGAEFKITTGRIFVVVTTIVFFLTTISTINIVVIVAVFFFVAAFILAPGIEDDDPSGSREGGTSRTPLDCTCSMRWHFSRNNLFLSRSFRSSGQICVRTVSTTRITFHQNAFVKIEYMASLFNEIRDLPASRFRMYIATNMMIMRPQYSSTAAQGLAS